MAKRIRIDQIGDFAEDKLDQLMRVVVLETDGRLKKESPVDTGRFRASWVIGENGTQSSTDVGPGKHQAGPPRGGNYTAGTEEFGNNYHIHNTLPYAESLANGHSKQAPAGWVDLISKEMTRRARQLADDLGRKD